jgi:putative aminopeptidase FrvX
MEKLPSIDQKYLKELLVEILNIPCPTGYTEKISAYLNSTLTSFPELRIEKTGKGALVAVWRGKQPDIKRGFTAHVDTLGAMVKKIKSNGRIKITQIGGYPWNFIEGESCEILTNGEKTIKGSILIDHASHHVYGEGASKRDRNGETLEVRLDIATSSQEKTREYGVSVGDFVFLDPRTEVVNNFFRSRHLDDKAGVACLITAIQALHQADLQPNVGTVFHFSNYEEVGHGGASGITDSIEELITIDMAAVGEGQNSDEFHTSLCIKDSRGPYHYRLNKNLEKLARRYGIPYRVDIYPHYGSDGEAYWRAGGNAKVALIGPGVDASHNYERTHLKSLIATTQWIMACILSN